MKKLLALLLALVMVLGMTACAGSGKDDTVTLKIWFHGSNVTPEASEKVMKEVNAYLKDKLNVQVEPIWGT